MYLECKYYTKTIPTFINNSYTFTKMTLRKKIIFFQTQWEMILFAAPHLQV